MNDQHGELAPLISRVKSLERWNRFLALSVVLSIVIALWSLSIERNEASGTELELRKLSLRDKKGNVRYVLDVDGDGTVSQRFLDSNRKERIKVFVTGDNFARLQICDERETTRVAAATFPEDLDELAGRASLAVLGHGNANGTLESGGLLFTTAQDGTVDQSIFDKSGQLRIDLGWYPSIGASAIDVYGPSSDHKCAVQIGTSDEGRASQTFFGANGEGRIMTTTDPQGDASQFLLDSGQNTRFYLGVDSRGVAREDWRDVNNITRVRTIVVPKGTNATGIGAEGYSAQLFYDNKGALRIDTSTYGNGQASSDYSDQSGKVRMSLITFPGADAVFRLSDVGGRVRQYTGTFSNGDCGGAILGRDGSARFSTMVDRNDSLSVYQEKSAATRMWETAGTVLQLIDIGERIGLFDNSN